MGTTLVDGRMSVTLPEGFRIMDAAELKAAYSLDYENMWGARDEERHIILTIVWKDSGKLARKLVGIKDLAQRSEKALAKAYRKHGYHKGDFFQAQVAGMEARGFNFVYDYQGVPQQGEVLVFLAGARCYTLYYYTRPELAEQNQALFDGIRASAKIS